MLFISLIKIPSNLTKPVLDVVLDVGREIESECETVCSGNWGENGKQPKWNAESRETDLILRKRI